jgi:hypothetical protein
LLGDSPLKPAGYITPVHATTEWARRGAGAHLLFVRHGMLLQAPYTEGGIYLEQLRMAHAEVRSRLEQLSQKPPFEA